MLRKSLAGCTAQLLPSCCSSWVRLLRTCMPGAPARIIMASCEARVLRSGQYPGMHHAAVGRRRCGYRDEAHSVHLLSLLQ